MTEILENKDITKVSEDDIEDVVFLGEVEDSDDESLTSDYNQYESDEDENGKVNPYFDDPELLNDTELLEIRDVFLESEEENQNNTIFSNEIGHLSYVKSDGDISKSFIPKKSESFDEMEDDETVLDIIVFSSKLKYDFKDFINIQTLHEESDQGFYTYLQEEFENDLEDVSPIFFLYKLYEKIFEPNPQLMLVEEFLRSLTYIFSFIGETFPYYNECELDEIFSEEFIPFYKIIAENCSEYEGTSYFFKELIQSENFHLDKINLALSMHEGILSDLIFNNLLELHEEDFCNEEVKEFLDDLILTNSERIIDQKSEYIESVLTKGSYLTNLLEI